MRINKIFIYLILYFTIGCGQKKEEIFAPVEDYIFENFEVYNSGIKKADLNLDGTPDIVFGDFVLLGSGGGKFNEPQKKTNCETMGDFNSLNFIDFKKIDQDNIPDFLCIEHNDVNDFTVTVFKGDSDGDFNYLSSSIPDIPSNISDGLFYQIAFDHTYGDMFTKGVTGNFRGEGFTDVALSYFTDVPEDNSIFNSMFVILLLNDGMGNFRFSNYFETKPMVNVRTEVNDFNKDGLDDLLIYMVLPTDFTIDIPITPPLSLLPYTNITPSIEPFLKARLEKLSSIYLSNGDGTFSEKFSYKGYIYITGDDFNLDGKEDLTANTSSQVDVLINNGDGTFRVVPVSSVGADEDILEIISNDFNGDGLPDIAYGKYYCDYEKKICYLAINTLLNEGNELFVQSEEYITKESSLGVRMVTGDFNCDGEADIGLVYPEEQNENGGIEIILGNGKGGFKDNYFYEISEPITNNILAEDFSGDGGTDLAVERIIRVNGWGHAGLSLFVTQLCER